MTKKVFITGASSGIGYATALKVASEGNDVLICARRLDRLEKLKQEILSKYSVSVHAFELDVSSFENVQSSLSALPDDWKEVDVLVNNAGLSLGLDPFIEFDPKDWDQMIDTNIKGLLYVSQFFLKIMLKRNVGHIINIGSISGREVYPKGTVYCATKFAVRAISEGLKKEVHGTPIRISDVNPGIVDTEFSMVRFKNDQVKANNVYDKTNPLQPEDVADAIYYCLSRPAHVDIREIFITPTSQSSCGMIHKGG